MFLCACSLVAVSRSIRISEETWKQLRVEAAASGERMQALADALLMTERNGAGSNSAVLRVSEEAAAALRALARAEGRTLVAVVDRLVGVRRGSDGAADNHGDSSQGAKGRRVEVVSGADRAARCVCGHAEWDHRVKGKAARCQHVHCFPNGCRGFQVATEEA